MRSERFRGRRGRVVAILAFAIALPACDLFTQVCTDELNWAVSDTEIVVRIGDSETVSVVASTCGGRESLPTEMSWTSSDPSVASVDPLSGEISGVAVGDTRVTGVDGGTYGVGPVEVLVVVVE